MFRSFRLVPTVFMSPFMLLLLPLAFVLPSTHQQTIPQSSLDAVIPEEEFRLANATTYANGLLDFLSYDPSFSALVGTNATISVLAQKDFAFAHEGPVYLPARRQVFFTSNRLYPSPDDKEPTIDMWLLNLDTLAVDQIEADPPVITANGATFYGDDKVLVCSQGLDNIGGSLVVLDIATAKSEVVVNNWNGLPFNSPNDVVVYSDGSILFTDPDYGYEQGFRTEPQVGNYVWRFDPRTNTTAVVADNFIKPNGIVISSDGYTAYVTDTGFATGYGTTDPMLPRTIYAYDVVLSNDSMQFRNRRLFAQADTGIPDGVKLDEYGNLYAGTGGGVMVYNTHGKLIGRIGNTGVSNLVFADDELIMLQETKITSVKLAVKGATLPLP